MDAGCNPSFGAGSYRSISAARAATSGRRRSIGAVSMQQTDCMSLLLSIDGTDGHICDGLGRCFRFVCSYACAAVFFCCYRIFGEYRFTYDVLFMRDGTKLHYCARLIAKPKAARALRFSWAATSSTLAYEQI